MLMGRLRLTEGLMSLGPGSKMEEALGAHECVGSSAHLGISDPHLGWPLHRANGFHKYHEEITQETGLLEATDCLELT